MSMTGTNGGGKIRILIADDHEMVLDVFAMYLSSASDMEVTTGKTLEEALQLQNTDIVEELALPPVKIHCSVLAEDAIKAAIADYRQKNGITA